MKVNVRALVHLLHSCKKNLSRGLVCVATATFNNISVYVMFSHFTRKVDGQKEGWSKSIGFLRKTCYFVLQCIVFRVSDFTKQAFWFY